MRRREFIAGLGSVTVLSRKLAAQPTGLPVIGLLSTGTAEGYGSVVLPGLRAGLSESGYSEGKNLAIDYRWGTDLEHLRATAADLAARKVAAIVTFGPPQPALAANAVTQTIPIIFATGADAVAVGIVSSLSRPSGNITGVNYRTTEFESKKLQLLHDLVPGNAPIAVLAPSVAARAAAQLSELQTAAQAMGEQIRVQAALTGDRELETAYLSFSRAHVRALLVAAAAPFTDIREKLVALAARLAVPTIYPAREFTLAGGLASYGPSYFESHRQVGIYVGRILEGVKPADLPVWQPTRSEFVINLKTAKVLGLNIPPGVLAIADEVIE